MTRKRALMQPDRKACVAVVNSINPRVSLGIRGSVIAVIAFSHAVSINEKGAAGVFCGP